MCGNKRGGEMSPRMGRPKADNPKSIKYSIRLDEVTENKLQHYCDNHKITKGEAIRQGIELLLDKKNKQVIARRQSIEK